jgi:hypothetical protein
MPKSRLNFPKYFDFDFFEFSMTKLFKIQYLLQYKSKHYETTLVHPYSSRAPQWYQECGGRCHGSRDLNVTKQAKQTNYLHESSQLLA